MRFTKNKRSSKERYFMYGSVGFQRNLRTRDDRIQKEGMSMVAGVVEDAGDL